MNILGLNYYHPDSSACLIKNGELTAAAEEERFVRIKHFSGFPENSINFCLNFGNLKLSDIDFVALNYHPLSNFKGKFLYTLKNFNKITTFHKLIGQKNKLKNQNKLKFFLNNNNFKGKIINVDHHLSHLCSSYFLSNFKKSIGLTIDGFGDFCSMESFLCEDRNIKKIKKVLFPHSLGIFYQATTQFLGFKNYGDEYKLMGLASYGEPRYLDEFSEIVRFSEKNYFKLNLNYFTHHTDKKFKYFFENGNPIFNNLYSDLFKKKFGEPRSNNDPIEKKHMDIASSMQKHFEDIILSILNKLYNEYKIDKLCLSGGCAFNSKLNGLIREKTKFKEVFIQPNAGDAGGSIGASISANLNFKKKDNKIVSKNNAYLGPSYSNEDIEAIISDRNDLGDYQVNKLSDNKIYSITAEKIFNNLIIGWFKGRMEWGPRALGNRSILANPTNKNIKDVLNLKIKLREKFRPFAPSVLFEHKEKYFKIDYHSPYMLNVVEAKKIARETIPAVVHVDNTCRVQTVKREENEHFYNLINEFYLLSGVPVLVNTSFNENEPIVQNPQQAIDCFLRTKMDYLVLENWTISR